MANQAQTSCLSYCVAMTATSWLKAERVLRPGLLQKQQVTSKYPLVIWGGLGRVGNGGRHCGTKTWTELLKRDNVNTPEQIEPLF